MSHFAFPASGAAPAAGEPFEYTLQRWVRAHGGSEALAQLAARVRRGERRGDSCLDLHAVDPAADVAATPVDLEALAGEALVGDGRVPTPFVLDPAGRLYFHRNWRNERRIAEQLRSRRATPGALPAGADALLDRLFADADPQFSARQRDAVRAAFGRRLLVLTGGPGTGKTSTVLRLLLAQVAQRADLRIRLAAPTGKAAQRLADALREGAARLARLDPGLVPLLDGALASPPATVHRLLGYQPHSDRFRHGREHRLEVDLVLVDEASMLDIATLSALLDALPDAALLVLVGDPDQLSPVATGSALDDLVRAFAQSGEPALLRLQHGFRSDARLQAVLAAVRDGDGEAFRRAAADAGGQFRQAPPAQLDARLQAWADALDQRIAPLRRLRDADAAAALLQAWQRDLLLCALRDGPFGARELAARIDAELRRRWAVPDAQAWYPGRAVLVRRNDYGRELFNGDLGVALPEAGGELRVWFPRPSGDAAGLRHFAPADLPAHESAAALTVHRSQGSECRAAVLVLPPDPDNPLLSRQLLYTALSRARERVELWAREREVELALARRIVRVGGLHDALLASG